MKTLFAILLIVSGCGACLAADFTDENVLGFFFDSAAAFNCVEAAPYQAVPVHLLLVNASDSAVYGYEFGYTVSGSYLIQSVDLKGQGAIDVGGYEGNHIVGLASPLTTGTATLLATVSIFIMDDQQVSIELHNSDPASLADASDVPALLYVDDEIVSVVLSTPAGFPNARINGICNPETLEESWDGVKSMYQ